MKRELFYFDHKPRLNNEYRKTFDEIEEYCKLVLMDSESFDDSMNYLMDVFLTAQENKMPVKKITGGNIESFCKSFINDTAHYSMPSRILEIVKGMMCFFIFMMLVFIILPQVFFDGIELQEALNGISKYSLGILTGVTIGVIASMAADLVYRQIIFKLKKYRKFYHILLNWICIAICIGVIMIIPIEEDIDFNLSNGTLLLICAVALICCCLIRGFMNKASGKTFFNKQKRGEKETTFTASVMQNMINEFRKQYEKENIKRAKKGKSRLTHDEFMEKIYKDNQKNKISTVISCVLLAIFYIGMIIWEALQSTVLDTIIFSVILFVIYIIIMWPLSIYPLRTRKKFIYILRKNNKTVFDEDIWNYIK